MKSHPLEFALRIKETSETMTELITLRDRALKIRFRFSKLLVTMKTGRTCLPGET